MFTGTMLSAPGPPGPPSPGGGVRGSCGFLSSAIRQFPVAGCQFPKEALDRQNPAAFAPEQEAAKCLEPQQFKSVENTCNYSTAQGAKSRPNSRTRSCTRRA